MKISIITPSYNQAQFLEQTIDSVHSQGVPVEHIVIDGGSTDGSVDILKKYDKHLSHWESAPDRGQSHAINKGLKHATGDVINWLNSDDYLQPEALKVIAAHFEDPSVFALCGRSNIIQGDQVIRQTQGTDVYENNLAKTIGLARIDQPETWFRKDTFESVTPLEERLHFVMDKYLWIKYLMKYGLGGVRKINDILANFRLHDDSKTVAQSDLFTSESVRLYGDMARCCGREDVAVALDGSSSQDQLQFPEFGHVDLSHAIDYQLLYLADLYYTRFDYKFASQFLKLVNDDHFSWSDKKWCLKLKFSIWAQINRFRKP